MALQVMPYVHSPCRIGRGNPAAAAKSGIRVQRIAVAAHPVQQRLLRRHRYGQLEIGCTLGRFGRRRRTALTTEAAFAAGEDRPLLCPQQRAVGRGHRRLRPDDRGLALVPDVGEPGDRDAGRPTAARDRAPMTASLACSTLESSMSMPGKLHRRRLGHVEALRDVAERRQHLRGVVGEVAQLPLVHRVATRTEPKVVELDVATGPREFGRFEFGGQRLVHIDRH